MSIMKRFLINIVIIAIPFALYSLVIVIIDPFNYLDISDIVDDSKKWDISAEVQPHLYRMIAYEHNPRNNIALGDSRSNSLFYSMNTQRWSNLSFAGGTIKEIIDAFWWAAEGHEIDTVLIGMSLNNYNKYEKRVWVEETIATTKNYFSYAFNRFTMKCSWLIVKSYLTKKEIEINPISMTRDEFWQFQITETPLKLLGKYAYPDDYYAGLQEIATYCKENGITLIFWIPPEHMDYQNSLRELNLTEANQRFKEDLFSLGEVYDFNYPNEITLDREKYLDPLHINEETMKLIVSELTGSGSNYSRHHVPN